MASNKVNSCQIQKTRGDSSHSIELIFNITFIIIYSAGLHGFELTLNQFFSPPLPALLQFNSKA